MNHSLQLEQIEKQLLENHDTVIWSQKVSTRGSLVLRILQTFGIMLVIILLGASKSDFSGPPQSFSWIAVFSTLAFFSIVAYEVVVTITFATLIYSVSPNHISFQWGYFKKKRVDIPFSEITTINLVEYRDKNYSTIHFGTKHEYEEILRINYGDFDSRPHITFEKLKDGQKVYDLLDFLHKSSQHR